MKITEVRLYIVNDVKLKAYGIITLDDAFIIRDLKVIQGNAGLFVAMPTRKLKDGEYQDIAHPINNEMREYVEAEVLKAYHQRMEEIERDKQEVRRLSEQETEDEEEELLPTG